MTGSGVLSSADYAAAKMGQTYVNVHSTTFGGGELRGMVLIYQTVFAAEMDPMQASVGNGGGNVWSNAMGQGLFTLDDTGSIGYTVSFNNLNGTLASAHIHAPALPNQNSGILFPFDTTDNVGQQNGVIQGETGAGSCNAWCMWLLVSGQSYANIHTNKYPAGELRGRIWPSEQTNPPSTDDDGSYMQMCRGYNQTTPLGMVPVWQTSCSQTDADSGVTTSWLKVYGDPTSCMGDSDGSMPGLLAITEMGMTYIAGASSWTAGYDYALATTSSFEAVASSLAVSSLNMAPSAGGFGCGAAVCGADFVANMARTITPATAAGCAQCTVFYPEYLAVQSWAVTPGDDATDLYSTGASPLMSQGWYMPNPPLTHMTWQEEQCVDFVATWTTAPSGSTGAPMTSTGAGPSTHSSSGLSGGAASVEASAVAAAAAIALAVAALL